MRLAITLLLGAGIAFAPLPAASQTAAPAPACDATSVDSPPGRIWWAEQRWRYASDAAAADAYRQLVTGQSPWPSWFVPTVPNPPLAVLPVGTRFQMAMAPTQKDDAPGGWGTFDNIADVEDVREFLAVTTASSRRSTASSRMRSPGCCR
ncbi:MAG: hypothetical protein WDN24_12945 [Sphingomonas sp.]